MDEVDAFTFHWLPPEEMTRVLDTDPSMRDQVVTKLAIAFGASFTNNPKIVVFRESTKTVALHPFTSIEGSGRYSLDNGEKVPFLEGEGDPSIPPPPGAVRVIAFRTELPWQVSISDLTPMSD